MAQPIAEPIAELFVKEALFRLQEEYLPRIHKALAALKKEDLWWRPHGDTTSIGSLLRHLRGNIGQWVVSGLGGKDDSRDRKAEFAGAPEQDAAALMEDLEATLAEACAVIASLDAKKLAAEHPIQGYRVTGLRAVFHIVEHFSWHAGQITWIAKLRAGEGHGLAFYDDVKLNKARNPGHAAG